MSNERKRYIAAGAVLAAVAAFYLIFGCPIRLFTGVSCPACGMSRACLACLRLDLSQAFHLHPLVFLLPVAAALFLWKRKNRRICYAVLFSFCAALVAVWLIRMFSGSDIVYFRPSEGVIYQFLRSVYLWLLPK